jgi:hypothetical protein
MLARRAREMERILHWTGRGRERDWLLRHGVLAGMKETGLISARKRDGLCVKRSRRKSSISLANGRTDPSVLLNRLSQLFTTANLLVLGECEGWIGPAGPALSLPGAE